METSEERSCCGEEETFGRDVLNIGDVSILRSQSWISDIPGQEKYEDGECCEGEAGNTVEGCTYQDGIGEWIWKIESRPMIRNNELGMQLIVVNCVDSAIESGSS